MSVLVVEQFKQRRDGRSLAELTNCADGRQPHRFLAGGREGEQDRQAGRVSAPAEHFADRHLSFGRKFAEFIRESLGNFWIWHFVRRRRAAWKAEGSGSTAPPTTSGNASRLRARIAPRHAVTCSCGASLSARNASKIAIASVNCRRVSNVSPAASRPATIADRVGPSTASWCPA